MDNPETQQRIRFIDRLGMILFASLIGAVAWCCHTLAGELVGFASIWFVIAAKLVVHEISLLLAFIAVLVLLRGFIDQSRIDIFLNAIIHKLDTVIIWSIISSVLVGIVYAFISNFTIL